MDNGCGYKMCYIYLSRPWKVLIFKKTTMCVCVCTFVTQIPTNQSNIVFDFYSLFKATV
jgi:hypothetical protein